MSWRPEGDRPLHEQFETLPESVRSRLLRVVEVVAGLTEAELAATTVQLSQVGATQGVAVEVRMLIQAVANVTLWWQAGRDRRPDNRGG